MTVSPGPNTLGDILRTRVSLDPNGLAFEYRTGDRWDQLTWSDVLLRVDRIAAGLQAVGVKRGDRVAILSGTRVEWVLVDFAILMAGVATTTIYPSSTAAECHYILSDSQTVMCVVENQSQYSKVNAIVNELESLTCLCAMEDVNSLGDNHWTLESLEELGAQRLKDNPNCVLDVLGAMLPEELACLIYTSGTTGEPKGVRLTHQAFLALAEQCDEYVEVLPGDKQFLFLPLAHVYGKVCELLAIHVGVPTAIDGSVEQILDSLACTRPTVMAAVPRIFEKIFNTVHSRAQQGGPVRYRVFQWALNVGRRVSVVRQAGEEPSGLLKLRYRVAEKLVFSKIKAIFGGRMRVFLSGGAPLSVEIARFFHACDMLILEGYGLTETSAVATANRLDAYRFGTVGKPAPGVEIRVEADGELAIRSRTLMQGYHNKDEATKDAIRGGWFYTGDIGSFDDDGFLRITDRKKNLIITSGGKNIAPQKIENMIKAESAYISQAVLYGDKRKYCVALLAIDEESVGAWGIAKGLGELDYANLVAHPEVKILIDGVVNRVNAMLPRHETIKRFQLLDHDLTLERGELTPSLKVRRRALFETYSDVLDAMYERDHTVLDA